jgi:MtN3 and saliva related transmembrane protein
MGLIASFLIPIAFVPQVIRLFQLKSAREISIPFTTIQLVGMVLWLTYGFRLGLMPVIVCNAAMGILVIMILVAKIKYGR